LRQFTDFVISLFRFDTIAEYGKHTHTVTHTDAFTTAKTRLAQHAIARKNSATRPKTEKCCSRKKGVLWTFM